MDLLSRKGGRIRRLGRCVVIATILFLIPQHVAVYTSILEYE